MAKLNKEEIEKLVPIERMVMLQGFVDYYLVKTEGKAFYELYPDIEDKYGILNSKQEEILHLFLEDEYKSMDLDLREAILDAGSKPVENGLSDFEKKELLRMADKELLVIGSILKRKEKLYKK